MAASIAQLSQSLAAVSLGGSTSCSFAGLRANKSSPALSLSASRTSPAAVAPSRLSVRCARVAGVEIPNQKRIETSLTYIHGVGKTTARQVLLDVGLENKYTRELTEEELTRLREEVAKYMTEGDLRRFNLVAIKRLKDIMCYRGRRHIASLPCRGQSTKCNARTRRGKKVTVAGKKK
eukprot:TRINITY_DN78261_c0_g1_i1.p2 TRINITY_DN78261_c0_g1~~TRINITY_DN78261_c0_g1_i1.p2  ORF type:complete len:178 (-),score=6.19 TRINITY_DN78261_c0_g1_i1:211-744(-)